MYHPAHFYFQLLDDQTESAFERLMAEIQAEFQSGPYEARSWARGTPVAAQFRDNCWYRAQVGWQLGTRYQKWQVAAQFRDDCWYRAQVG